MTMIVPLLALALVIEAVGSLCLITGYRARVDASVMFLYLGIVSVRLHAFWNQTGMSVDAAEHRDLSEEELKKARTLSTWLWNHRCHRSAAM